MTRLTARPAFAGSVAALALLVPLAGCGSSSSASTAASTAQSTTTTTPMASASDSPSMEMSPSDSASATDATSSATDPTSSATDATSSASDSASAAAASATSTAGATSTAVSGKKMAFAAKKDAKVPATLTPYPALTMKKVVFPKTLGGMPMLGTVSEGQATRSTGYSDLSTPTIVTTTASTNSDAADVDNDVNDFKNVSSYDGGRMKCGKDVVSDSQACVVHIAGPEQITVSTTAKLSNDQLAKYAVEFLNAQK